jgi:hypothetical protein
MSKEYRIQRIDNVLSLERYYSGIHGEYYYIIGYLLEEDWHMLYESLERRGINNNNAEFDEFCYKLYKDSKLNSSIG